MKTSFAKKSEKTTAAPQRAGISRVVFFTSFAILCVTNVLTLVALYMTPEIAGLVDNRSDAIRVSYQNRIVQLRQEVDRLHSRQYAQAGNLNLQLQELAHQHELLTEQHQFVRTLAAKAGELGIETAAAPVPVSRTVDATLVTGSVNARPDLPDLDYVTQSMQEMMRDNQTALANLSEGASQSTEAILSALADLGISPTLSGSSDGVGGPFEPLPSDTANLSLVDQANAVMAAFGRFDAARKAAQSAPISRPLEGKVRISSNFGTRRDPFMKKNAFHAGMDFSAPRGTPVRAAGDGVVIKARRASGYGNLVEIRHASGLTTRYAHLSKFQVSEGQKVKAGDVIANVGSTGRSTGPHLHFEVRRNDSAVNPSRYLTTGRTLAKFL